MILLEIPMQTFQMELVELELLAPDDQMNQYVAGAKAAIKWLLEGDAAPHKIVRLASEPNRTH